MSFAFELKHIDKVEANLNKRHETIEKLIQWTYRDEMPKQVVGELTGWERSIFVLGTRVDTSNRDYEATLPVALGPPHPDALRIDYAVRSLPPVKVNWTRDRDFLLGDLVGCLSDDELIAKGMATAPRASRIGFRGARASRVAELVSPEALTPASLIQAHAILGTRPIWDIGQPKLVRINEVNGQPKLIGKCYAKDRYAVGSFCPVKLEPSGAEIACARWEYFVWFSALMAVAEAVGDLESFRIMPPNCDPAPWRPSGVRNTRFARATRPFSGQVMSPAA